MRFTKDMQLYREVMNDLNMHDLGFKGYKFTWINGREGQGNIQCRLDRMWANTSWKILYSSHPISHKTR